MTDIIQGSPEWHSIRLGKVTASRVADVVAKTKTGWGASRDDCAAELIAERLAGTPAASFTNDAMVWGTECEPHARAAYCFYRDCDVTEVGFVEHPTIEMVGCSPDGLVGADGLVEIKCPTTKTHIDTLLSHVTPAKYITQMQFQMAVTGRKYCDFVSFDPRMPEHMRLFVKRIDRDAKTIDTLEREVITFLSEIKSRLLGLEQLFRKTGSGMIVTEGNIHTALEFLADDPHPLAIAKYNARKATNFRKEAFARAFLAGDGGAEMRKATAEIAEEYMTAKETENECLFAVDKLESRKDAAENFIEVWRTENANARAAERIR